MSTTRPGAGHVSKRVSTRADGTKVTKWRARFPDPSKGPGAQIETIRDTKGEAEA